MAITKEALFDNEVAELTFSTRQRKFIDKEGYC